MTAFRPQRRTFHSACGALLLLASTVPLSALAQDAEPARLTFVKAFPKSKPEYTRVEVAETGEASYQSGTIADPEEPEAFQVSTQTTAELFRLAGELDNFRGLTLDVNRRIARMGEKTFVYQTAAERFEVKYNYTENLLARELQDLFERIARGRYLLWELNYRARFDRLGVPEILRQFDAALSSGGLVDLESFVPTLTRIVNNVQLMKLARNHARRLLDRVRNQSAVVQLEYGDGRTDLYASLILNEEGNGTLDLRKSDAARNPRPVRLPAQLTGRLWEVVGMAGRFQGKQPVSGPPRLIGYRFTYEKEAERNVTAFSSPPTAALAEVVDILRRFLRQQSYLDRLHMAIEKDSYMLQVLLQDLEKALMRRSLAAPGEFVPILEGLLEKEGRHPIEQEIVRRILQQIRSAGQTEARRRIPTEQ